MYDFSLIQENIPKLVSDAQNAYLISLPGVEEIKKATLSMNPEGAGLRNLMGLVAFFYKHCWEIIKNELVGAIHAFFRGQSIPKSWTSTLIMKGGN